MLSVYSCHEASNAMSLDRILGDRIAEYAGQRGWEAEQIHLNALADKISAFGDDLISQAKRYEAVRDRGLVHVSHGKLLLDAIKTLDSVLSSICQSVNDLERGL